MWRAAAHQQHGLRMRSSLALAAEWATGAGAQLPASQHFRGYISLHLPVSTAGSKAWQLISHFSDQLSYQHFVLKPPGCPVTPFRQDETYVALVTGATGLVGRHIVQHLAGQVGWRVLAITRQGTSSLDYEEADMLHKDAQCIEASSLTNKDAVKWALENVPEVTHLFHCAYHAEEHPAASAYNLANGDLMKEMTVNLSMLTNVVEALESGPSKNTLRSIFLMAGTKCYGPLPGLRKTPVKEDDPRSLTPHLFHALEDYARYRTENGAEWTWSELRPHLLVGYSPHSHMNLLNSIGVYAAITQALGMPFSFPGSNAAYNAISECVDARTLAAAAVYVATAPECKNQAFNVSNGDVFRWSELWPRIADHFGLDLAPPQEEFLEHVMNTPDKKAAWRALCREHGLVHRSLDDLVSWDYADHMLSDYEHDYFSSTISLTQEGFEGQCVDTTDSWIEHLQFLIDMGVLPPLGTQEKEVENKLLIQQKVPVERQLPRYGYKLLKAAVDAPEGAEWLKEIYDTVQENGVF